MGLIMKMTVCFQSTVAYTYIAELFGTKYRSFVMGFSLTLGKIMSSLGPYFILLASTIKIHPCLMGILSVVVGLPSAYYLPETKGKSMKN